MALPLIPIAIGLGALYLAKSGGLSQLFPGGTPGGGLIPILPGTAGAIKPDQVPFGIKRPIAGLPAGAAGSGGGIFQGTAVLLPQSEVSKALALASSAGVPSPSYAFGWRLKSAGGFSMKKTGTVYIVPAKRDNAPPQDFAFQTVGTSGGLDFQILTPKTKSAGQIVKGAASELENLAKQKAGEAFSSLNPFK